MEDKTINFGDIWIWARGRAEAVCIEYATSSPVVSRWADGLFIQLEEQPDKITLGELAVLGWLVENGEFVAPNCAQNKVYKWLESQGVAQGILDF